MYILKVMYKNSAKKTRTKQRRYKQQLSDDLLKPPEMRYPSHLAAKVTLLRTNGHVICIINALYVYIYVLYTSHKHTFA